MSLINQMLRDLDARHGAEGPLGRTRSVGAPRAGSRPWFVAGIFAAVLAAAGVFTAWQLLHGRTPPTTTSHPEPTTKTPTPLQPKRGAGNKPTLPALISTTRQPTPRAPIAQLSAVIAGAGDDLILTFSPPLHAPVLAGPERSIRATIPATTELESLGSPPHLRGLTTFRLQPTPAGLVLFARAAPGYSVRLGPAANATPLGAALALVVIPPPPQTRATPTEAAAKTPVLGTAHAQRASRRPTNPSSATPSGQVPAQAQPSHATPSGQTEGRNPSTSIERIPETPAQRATADYDRAVTLLRQGDNARATALLKEALATNPGNSDARLLLAGVLARSGENGQALSLLETGIAGGQPESARLARLQARILAGQGHLRAAITALKRNAPSLQDNPDYHAELAAYEERAGQYSAAASEYRGLVSIAPGQGRWWLGLAIALDQLDRPGAANAYHQAIDAGNLSSTATNYARHRLRALGGLAAPRP